MHTSLERFKDLSRIERARMQVFLGSTVKGGSRSILLKNSVFAPRKKLSPSEASILFRLEGPSAADDFVTWIFQWSRASRGNMIVFASGIQRNIRVPRFFEFFNRIGQERTSIQLPDEQTNGLRHDVQRNSIPSDSCCSILFLSSSETRKQLRSSDWRT